MSTQLSFLDFQNSPEPDQSDEFQKISDETRNAPHLQMPQRYFLIKKKLNKSQDHICCVVLQKTYSLHRKSCKMTTKDFMGGGACKKRMIMRAKAQLLSMGLLVRKGKREFCIDLFFDKRKREMPPKPENHPKIQIKENNTPNLSNKTRITDSNEHSHPLPESLY